MNCRCAVRPAAIRSSISLTVRARCSISSSVSGTGTRIDESPASIVAARSVMTDTGRSARRVASPAIAAVTITPSGTPTHSPRYSDRRLSVSLACEACPTSSNVFDPIVTTRRTVMSSDANVGPVPGWTAIASTPSGVVMLTVPVPPRRPASSWSTTLATRSRMELRPLLAM